MDQAQVVEEKTFTELKHREEEIPKRRIQLTVQKEKGAYSSNFPRRHTMDVYSIQLKFQK